MKTSHMSLESVPSADPTPIDFAFAMTLHDLSHMLFDHTNAKNKRQADKAYKAIAAALNDLSEADPKVMANHCSMAILEHLFENVCEMVPTSWTAVDPIQHEPGCIHYQPPTPEAGK